MLKKLQEKYIFKKEALPVEVKFDCEASCTEMDFFPGENARINAMKFTVPDSKGIVLYNHGNTGTLERWKEVAPDFIKHNYDVLIYDYRQYGKSTGKLSEKNLLNDALYIFDELAKEYGEDKIIIYGRSLGTGIAAHTASERNAKALVLETPYFSLLDHGREEYIWVPAFLLHYKLRTDLFLPKVTAPVYIFHGTDDELIKYKSAAKLKSLLKPGDEFITIDGGKHSGLRHFDEYKNKLKEILS